MRRASTKCPPISVNLSCAIAKGLRREPSPFRRRMSVPVHQVLTRAVMRTVSDDPVDRPVRSKFANWGGYTAMEAPVGVIGRVIALQL